MKNIKLSKAITLALAGTAISLGGISNASAKSMYNTYNAHSQYTATDGGGKGTDGWVWGSKISYETHLALKEHDLPQQASPWVGTADSAAPFNYRGSASLNWATLLEGVGASQVISQQNAFDNYGIYADIDSTGGSWLDSNKVSWKHNTEIGLIKTDTTQRVHINISSLNGASQFGTAKYGATIFEGMDTTTGSFNHHGAWNHIDAQFDHDNPLYIKDPLVTGTGMKYLTHSPYFTPLEFIENGPESFLDSAIDGSTDLSFVAQAGEIYSILLGGYLGEDWNQQHDGHVINITTSAVSAVPIPTAAWLMGSGLMGLASFSRRKKRAA